MRVSKRHCYADTATTLVADATIHGFTSTDDIDVTGNASVSGDLTVNGEVVGASSGPVFLSTKAEIYVRGSGSSCPTNDWQVVDVTDHGVPADATAVILEAQGRTNDGITAMLICDTSPCAKPYVLIWGSAMGSSDERAWHLSDRC